MAYELSVTIIAEFVERTICMTAVSSALLIVCSPNCKPALSGLNVAGKTFTPLLFSASRHLISSFSATSTIIANPASLPKGMLGKVQDPSVTPGSLAPPISQPRRYQPNYW